MNIDFSDLIEREKARWRDNFTPENGVVVGNIVNDNRLFRGVGNKPGDTEELTVKMNATADEYKFFVPRNITYREIMELIEIRTGIPVHLQQLICQGKALECHSPNTSAAHLFEHKASEDLLVFLLVKEFR